MPSSSEKLDAQIAVIRAMLEAVDQELLQRLRNVLLLKKRTVGEAASALCLLLAELISDNAEHEAAICAEADVFGDFTHQMAHQIWREDHRETSH